jgi:hypothetical protein
MPLGGGLTAGLLAGGGSLLGGLFGGGPHIPDVEKKLLYQELAQMQKMFPQFMADATALQNFYSPYMQQGSPFLKNIQAASAGQNAQQYNNAAGTLRGQLQQQGQGFGPSGASAAALGGIGVQQANNAASNYLSNILQNEQLKFQASQGLSNVFSNLKPGQPATANLGYQAPQPGLGGAIQNAGNALGQINFNRSNPVQGVPQSAGTGSEIATLLSTLGTQLPG